MTKHKSMRGVDVDVDLIRMKQELMSGKKTEPNIKREDYVSDRRRRSSSKRIDEMFANEQVVRQKLAEQKLADKAVDVLAPTPVLPVTVESIPEIENDPAIFEESQTITETQELPKGRVVKKQG